MVMNQLHVISVLIMVLYICILKGCKDLVKKLVDVYISDIHVQVLYTPTSFFTRGIHEIYTPAIEQSDWSECTSHGANSKSYDDVVDRITQNPIKLQRI